MRYSLRALMVLLTVGPPVIALAWWYGRVVVTVFVLTMIVCPDVLFLVFGYTFGGLCHWIGKLPEGPRRKNSN